LLIIACTQLTRVTKWLMCFNLYNKSLFQWRVMRAKIRAKKVVLLSKFCLLKINLARQVSANETKNISKNFHHISAIPL
jgi:hypothetical protein